MKIILTKDKTTPNTTRFKEDSTDHPVAIYLTDERMKELDNPESISMVIEKES